MIKTFRRKDTEKIFQGAFATGLPRDIHRVALHKLTQIHGATTLEFLRIPPGNRLEKLVAREKANGASGSTINGGYASTGRTAMRITSKLLITIKGEKP